jgi:hypothetical protein
MSARCPEEFTSSQFPTVGKIADNLIFSRLCLFRILDDREKKTSSWKIFPQSIGLQATTCYNIVISCICTTSLENAFYTKFNLYQQRLDWEVSLDNYLPKCRSLDPQQTFLTICMQCLSYRTILHRRSAYRFCIYQNWTEQLLPRPYHLIPCRPHNSSTTIQGYIQGRRYKGPHTAHSGVSQALQYYHGSKWTVKAFLKYCENFRRSLHLL